MSVSRRLFRAARVSRNAEVLASGSPTKIARRAKNIALGRALARTGFWRIWR
jgi:hypothetical protein